LAPWLPKLRGKFFKKLRSALAESPSGTSNAARSLAVTASGDNYRMRITVLAGGVGASRFLRGLVAAAPDAKITVIGNTADDITLFGLRVCPDLDTVMYTLGGGINVDQGWGRADETFSVGEELAAYGAEPSWFTLGDRDFATHILRTQLLGSGLPLSAVTRTLCERWRPGVELLPMSDDTIETHVRIKSDSIERSRVSPKDRPASADPPAGQAAVDPAAGATELIHFQEWWVRLHAAVPASAIIPVGAAEAAPAPGVLEAIAEADFVLFPPSNPVVSIGPILAVPGIRAAVSAKTVVAVSGIIGGAPVRGMADVCLTTIGVETTATAVAAHYGADLINGWLVDEQDKAAADDPALAGIAVRALPLYMRDVPSTTAIAQAAIDLAQELAR
jgi:LPPG:FO 2-phospho-L-lactate transferase